MTINGLAIPPVYVTRTLAVASILVVTMVAIRIVGGLVRRAMGRSGAVPATSIFVNITRALVAGVGAAFILDVLDISITPVLTALGVGGLAVALALQDTLSNLFAGLQLIASKQIRPGDYLLLESGQEGTVEDIAWRYTTLRTQQNNLVVVPNAKLGATIVTNYVLPEQPLSVLVEFGVAYGSDLERVQSVVAEVASAVMTEMQPDIEDWEPIVRFKAFSDSQIQVVAVLRTLVFGDQFALKSEFIKRLHARFTTEGIDFPTPVRTVHLVQS